MVCIKDIQSVYLKRVKSKGPHSGTCMWQWNVWDFPEAHYVSTWTSCWEAGPDHTQVFLKNHIRTGYKDSIWYIISCNWVVNCTEANHVQKNVTNVENKKQRTHKKHKRSQKSATEGQRSTSLLPPWDKDAIKYWKSDINKEDQKCSTKHK